MRVKALVNTLRFYLWRIIKAQMMIAGEVFSLSLVSKIWEFVQFRK
jgi:hypothetical protein